MIRVSATWRNKVLFFTIIYHLGVPGATRTQQGLWQVLGGFAVGQRVQMKDDGDGRLLSADGWRVGTVTSIAPLEAAPVSGLYGGSGFSWDDVRAMPTTRPLSVRYSQHTRHTHSPVPRAAPAWRRGANRVNETHSSPDSG